MQEGEVRAQFRLLGDNVKGDVAKIQGDIQSQIKQSGKGTPLSQVNRDLEANIAFGHGGKGGMGKVSSKMLAAMSPEDRAWVLSRGSGGGGGGFKGKPPPILADLKAKMDRAKFIKDATFAMMPLFNPTSVWGNLFASRQIFSAFSSTKTGLGLMGKAGLAGTGGAALATGGVVGVLLAVGLAIKGLAKVMHESVQAYKDAPKLYAKAMTSGLGLKFVSKRSMLAEIMGVSEQEVIKYGYAFQYLNPKIEWASSIMAKTNTNLTSVGWSFKILGENTKAMFADIADKAAPAMRIFADGLGEIIKEITDWIDKHQSAMAKIELGAAFALAGTAGMQFGLDVMKRGKDSGPAPQPQSWMKQLPASSWEKMGLVIGGGGGANPAMQTAHNTKSMAQDMKKLVSYLARGSGAGTFNLQNAP